MAFQQRHGGGHRITGYSNGANHAVLHSSSCTCPACVDVALIEQDTMPLAGWLSLRREDVMKQASAIGDAMVDEYLMSIADQHDDMLDWQWMRGQID